MDGTRSVGQPVGGLELTRRPVTRLRPEPPSAHMRTLSRSLRDAPRTASASVVAAAGSGRAGKGPEVTDVVPARAFCPVPGRAPVRRAGAAVTVACVVLALASCQSATLPRGNAALPAPAAVTSTAAVPPADAGTSTASSPSAVAATSRAYPKPQVLAAGLVRGVQRWDRPITLHVHHGRLLSARVVDATTGKPLQGALSANEWVATGTAVPSRTYRVRADVRSLGAKTVHTMLTLRTSPPTATVDTDVSPYGGATVGVGAAIIVTFSRPVADQATASRALRVTTSTPVTGAWRWFSPTEAHWRPKVYWPAHTRVTLHEDLLGVQLAPGSGGCATGTCSSPSATPMSPRSTSPPRR